MNVSDVRFLFNQEFLDDLIRSFIIQANVSLILIRNNIAITTIIGGR